MKKNYQRKEPISSVDNMIVEKQQEQFKRSSRIQEKKQSQKDNMNKTHKESIKKQVEVSNDKKETKTEQIRRRLNSKNKKKEQYNQETTNIETIKTKKNRESNSKKKKEKELEGISNTIDEILNKLEKKKEKQSKKILNNKRNRSNSIKKHDSEQFKKTAKDYNFNFKPDIKAIKRDFININEASNNTTDIILCLMELALNSAYYQIPFQSRSNAFWKDVLSYKEVQRIFEGVSAESLRRFWNSIAEFDYSKIVLILKENKVFLNQSHIKLRTVIYGLTLYFQNKITDLEEYIKNIHIDGNHILKKKKPLEEKKIELEELKKQEIEKEQEKKQNNLEEPNELNELEIEIEKELKTKKKITQKKKSSKKQLLQNDDGNISIDEKKKEVILLFQTRGKKTNKLNESINNQEPKEDKHKIYALAESDKVLISMIDNIANDLCKVFKIYTKDYIMEILTSNSFNIANTYIMLKEFSEKQNISISALDKAFIQKVKDKR